MKIKKVKVISFVILFLLLAPFVTLELYHSHLENEFQTHQQDLVSKYAPFIKDFESDRGLLSKTKFFTRKSIGMKEANPALDWMLNTKFEDDLIIPYDLMKAITKSFNDWPKLEIDLREVDSLWISALHDFDYLNEHKETRLTPLGPSYHRSFFSVDPSENLYLWAKIHLLKGKNHDERLQARKDVRQLAWLIWTLNQSYYAQLAIEILRIEMQWNAVHGTEPSDLETLDKETLWAALKYFSALNSIESGQLPINFKAKLSEKSPHLCIAINEAIARATSYKQTLPHQFDAIQAQIDQWITNTEDFCRNGRLRVQWKTRTFEQLYKNNEYVFKDDSIFANVTDSLEKEEAWLSWGRVQQYPVLQKIIGYIRVMEFDIKYFEGYERTSGL